MGRTSRSARKPRAVTVIDEAIGRQLTKRRTMLGMSVVDLAKALDITHRQVQKYERGINRLSVSRLVQIAAVLEAPIGWFFLGLEQKRRLKTRIPGEALLELLAALPKPQEFEAMRRWVKDSEPTSTDPRAVRGRQRNRRRRA